METMGRKTSKAQSLAAEGAFLAAYTQKGWFLKIKPAFGIDKAIFAFVKKGDAAAEHFDIYMDADVFDLWCDDLLGDQMILQRTLQAEAQAGEKYPKGYKYITGENGEKSVGFAQSQVAGCITVNGCVGKTYANVPVPVKDLKIAAKKYKVAYAKRIEQLANETVISSTKWRDSQVADAISCAEAPSYEETPAPVASAEPPAEFTPAAPPAATPAPEQKDICINNGKVTATPYVLPDRPDYQMFMAKAGETQAQYFAYKNDLRVPESLFTVGGTFSCVGYDKQNYFLITAFV